MNYGVAPASNPGIAGMGTNIVVSVTSYGPVATEPKYQGGSNLNRSSAVSITLRAAWRRRRVTATKASASLPSSYRP